MMRWLQTGVFVACFLALSACTINVDDDGEGDGNGGSPALNNGGGGSGGGGANSSCTETCQHALSVCSETGYTQAGCETDCRDLLIDSDRACLMSSTGCGDAESCLDAVIARLESGGGGTEGGGGGTEGGGGGSSTEGGSGGGSSSVEDYCYDHTCNDSSTGERCFDNWDDYCDALCSESNCAAEIACELNCL